jgi:hypothetical protein
MNVERARVAFKSAWSSRKELLPLWRWRELGVQVRRDRVCRAVLKDKGRGQRDTRLPLELLRELCGAERIQTGVHERCARSHVLVSRLRTHSVQHSVEQLGAE